MIEARHPSKTGRMHIQNQTEWGKDTENPPCSLICMQVKDQHVILSVISPMECVIGLPKEKVKKRREEKRKYSEDEYAKLP